MRFIQTIRIVKLVSFLGLIGLLSGCENEDDTIVGFSDENTYSLSTYVEQNKETYAKFWQILEKTNLYAALNAYNPDGNGFTLFLPNDAAFDRYIQSSDKYNSFDALLNDLDFLNVLIRYHLVSGAYELNNFPYGALPDSTASGDYLAIAIQISADTSIYKINNVAPLVRADIQTTNGYIHIIDDVLEPITESGYEWLKNNENYSILSQAFEITGLDQLMGVQKTNSSGGTVKNDYTIFAESDSVFELANIHSVDDLIAKYHTEGMAYTDPNNGLYQFAAYHVLQGQYFLNDFVGATNYNTYAVYPVFVNSGLDIKINAGADTFKTIITDVDTTYINYISLDMIKSNVNTKNGPIHFISDLMELYKPSRKTVTLDFLNDPVLLDLSKSNGTYTLLDPEIYEFIYWEGPQTIVYRKAAVTTNSYIEISGDFLLRYTFPAILPGRYQVELTTNRNGADNATLQIKIDGKKVGSNINLTSGGSARTSFVIGTVDFTGTNEHIIEISSLIPGGLRWYSMRLIPV